MFGIHFFENNLALFQSPLDFFWSLLFENLFKNDFMLQTAPASKDFSVNRWKKFYNFIYKQNAVWTIFEQLNFIILEGVWNWTKANNFMLIKPNSLIFYAIV